MSISDLTDQVTNIKLQSKLGEVVTTSNAMSSTMFDTFIPANTSLIVNADGTGDFPTLKEALAYLDYKWSNGIVYIQLSTGTHIFGTTDKGTVQFKHLRGIPHLVITGAGIDSTIVDITEYILAFKDNPNFIWIANVSFIDTKHTNQDYVTAMSVENCGLFGFHDFKLKGGTLRNRFGSLMYLENNIEFHDTTAALICDYGARTILKGKIKCINIGYCFNNDYGGFISLGNVDFQYKNVIKYFGKWRTNNHFSQTGVIYSGSADGIWTGVLNATEIS